MPEDKKYIIALDQGTTSSRTIIFDKNANIVGLSQHEFTQHYPKAGWVEHDAMEIWATQRSTFLEAMTKTGIQFHEIAGIGITNQRETIVVWDKKTGRPIYNAIVWQCRRSVNICAEAKASGLESYVKEQTGLVIDPYFAGTKLKWILDNVDGARDKANKGLLLFGTIDTWLIWNLTQGKVHITDYTNASRTMLFNIHTLAWDEQLLDYFNIPTSMLPNVSSSSKIYGQTSIGGKSNAPIPIAGIAGDQQAALFGQLCVHKGMVKNTYGTGCFMLINTGNTPISSNSGLLTTLAIGSDCEVNYALEGSVFMGGATIQWLRDELKLIQSSADSNYYATQVQDTGGVYLVPAFVGLGAPFWDPNARGTIIGMTRGTNRNHIIRAALESIAYQSRDLIDAMQKDAGIKLNTLKVDGGAAANDFLMQFQADIMGTQVIRPQLIESTALGAAFLAGLAVKFWRNTEELKEKIQTDVTFEPNLAHEKREEL